MINVCVVEISVTLCLSHPTLTTRKEKSIHGQQAVQSTKCIMYYCENELKKHLKLQPMKFIITTVESEKK